MKKLLIIMLLIPLVFSLMDCGKKPPTKMKDIPEWYLNTPSAEDAIYGAGDASKKSLALAKKVADARARDQVSSTIETKVNNMVKDFLQESGLGQDAEALEFSSSVSKQVSANVLNFCEIVKREVKTEDGGYHAYSLAKYNLNSMINETKKAANRQKALYNEAKANLSFDELEKEIDKLKSVD